MDGKANERAHTTNRRHEEEIGELLRKERERPQERSRCSLPSKHDSRWPGGQLGKAVEKIILFSPTIRYFYHAIKH
jgi:hypothetical protein